LIEQQTHLENDKGFSGFVNGRDGLGIAPRGMAVAGDAHCQAVMWGFIANRSRLIQQLRLYGTPADDATVMVHAYRRWGSDLPRHVLGEYSVALWNRAASRAFITHDSLGLGPLYYSSPGSAREDRERLFFATHIIHLLDRCGQSKPDEEYLVEYLGRGGITSARTPYADIARLLPGESLIWEDGRHRLQRHWSIAQLDRVTLGSREAYQEELRALLEAGVRGCVAGAKTVWTHLSGGLDSSTVAAFAARVGAPNLAAWSVYWSRFPQVDERRWMRDLVDQYALPWYPVDIERAMPFSVRSTTFVGEPTNAPMFAAQSQANDRLYAQRQVEVVLSGHGGDAILGAQVEDEPTHLADTLFDGDFISAARSLRHWRELSIERRSYTYWIKNCVVNPALRHLQRRSPCAAPHPPLQPWFQPGYAQRVESNRRARPCHTPHCRYPGDQALAETLHVAALQCTLDAQQPRAYRMRYPLFHRPLVEFMCSIPFAQRLSPRCDRLLQRRALQGILPESIRLRADKGVGTPPFVEGLSRSAEWIDYLTTESELVQHGIADTKLWRQAIMQASVGQTHGDMSLHAGIAVEIWLKQLKEHRRARNPVAAGT